MRNVMVHPTLPLAKLEPFLKQMKAIDDLVKGFEELDTSK